MDNSSGLKPILSKFKKRKMIKFKKLVKLKNLKNVFWSQIICINIKITRFLTSKPRLTFIQLRQTYGKVPISQYFDL